MKDNKKKRIAFSITLSKDFNNKFNKFCFNKGGLNKSRLIQMVLENYIRKGIN